MLYQQNRGLSKFRGVQLKKMLTGKNVYYGVNIGSTRHDISLVSTPKDLETAMQLLYLNVVDPRYDDEEYQTGLSQIKAILPNLEKQPQFKFQEFVKDVLYGNNVRQLVLNSSIVEKANIADVEKVGKRLFANVAGAVVYVVGNVDSETLKPLVEKYVASLPGGKKGTKWTDRKEDFVKGEVIKELPVAMETPKTTVLQVYSADMPYSVELEALLDAAKLYLDMVYVETLRESEGGTYGASVATTIRREPKPVAILQVAFETNPESAEKLSKLALEGVQKLIEEGIPADKLDMIIKNIKKNIPQDRISNGYWLGNLQKNIEFGENYDEAYEKAVDAITSDAVVATLKKLVEQKNFIQLMMVPEK
jgi:zinc protease